MTDRIVSLIASATEIVAALGYGSQLVGRSHSCDFPPEVNELPICTEARINLVGSSLEIDTRVRDAVKDAFSIYRVFNDLLEELDPTLVITQTQCEVCAVNIRDVEAAARTFFRPQPEIVALEPMVLADLWADIHRIAQAVNDPQAGEKLVATLQARLETLSLTKYETRPTVACIEWIEPLMIAANWVPELVELVGGEAVLGKTGQHSAYISWEDLKTANPDDVVIMPCGFGIQRTLEELSLLTTHPGWKELQAVQTGKVFVADGHHFFNRSGPRLVDSAEIMREILHPESGPIQHPEFWQQV